MNDGVVISGSGMGPLGAPTRYPALTAEQITEMGYIPVDVTHVGEAEPHYVPGERIRVRSMAALKLAMKVYVLIYKDDEDIYYVGVFSSLAGCMGAAKHYCIMEKKQHVTHVTHDDGTIRVYSDNSFTGQYGICFFVYGAVIDDEEGDGGIS